MKNEPNAETFKAKIIRNGQIAKCTYTSCKEEDIFEVMIITLIHSGGLLYKNLSTDSHIQSAWPVALW